MTNDELLDFAASNPPPEDWEAEDGLWLEPEGDGQVVRVDNPERQ